uniref:Putative amino acid permease n=1 Tax=Parasteatoda tepidariorum TaxID=114398 RepID=A0A2L2Y5Z5_PARTP
MVNLRRGSELSMCLRYWCVFIQQSGRELRNVVGWWYGLTVGREVGPFPVKCPRYFKPT